MTTTTTTRRAMLAGTATVLAFAKPAAATTGESPTAAAFLDAASRLSTTDARRIKDGIAKANAADVAADPILDAIEAHRAAVAHHDAVQAEEFRLEEILPLNRRRWAMNSEESLDDAAKRDDHRWLENCIEGHHAFQRMDALAADLIEVRATTPAGVAALLAYVASELTRGNGNLPPCIDAPDEDNGPPLAEHRWLVLLLHAAAGALSGEAPHAA